MPLARVGRIVVDLKRCAKGQPAVGAACEHYISCAAPRRLHAGQHVNVIVSRAARTINRQKQLAVQSRGIDSAAHQHATHVDWRYLVECWRLIPELGVARANAVKHIVKITFAADEKISIRVHIESSQISRKRNGNGSLPGDPAISGPAELTTATAGRGVPGLVLETVSWAIGLVYGKPLLIASTCEPVRLQFRPRLATVC